MSPRKPDSTRPPFAERTSIRVYTSPELKRRVFAVAFARGEPASTFIERIVAEAVLRPEQPRVG